MRKLSETIKDKTRFFRIALASILLISLQLSGHAWEAPFFEFAGPDYVPAATGKTIKRKAPDGKPAHIDASKGKFFAYIEIKWTRAPRADCYEVYRRVKGIGDNWSMIKEIRSSGTLQILDKTALEGVEYEYQVRVVEFDKCTKNKIEIETREDSGFRKARSLKTPQATASGIVDVGYAAIFWMGVPKADRYHLQVLQGKASYLTPKNDETLPVVVDRLNRVVIDTVIKETYYYFDLPEPAEDVVSYWRVRAENELERSDYSEFKLLRPLQESIDLHERKNGEAIVESNCFSTRQKLIMLHTNSGIFINSTINSHKNESLVIFTDKPQTMAITVFDRFGGMVYQTNNLKTSAGDCVVAWDGSYGNAKAPAGSYTCLISVNSKEGKVANLAGSVRIVE